jgi:SAM-dependent methyltransferase
VTLALAFLRGESGLDFGARLERLRWRRAAGVRDSAEWPPQGDAAEALGVSDVWMVVTDSTALPVFRGAPAPSPGRILAAAWAVPSGGVVHTLRELEAARCSVSAAPDRPAALVLRPEDFPAAPSETVERYVERLSRSDAPRDSAAGFAAVRFEERSVRERAELTRRLPEGPLRILDAGCGAGGGIALAKPRHPDWSVTGIERDPELAARARSRCDRVLEGDLRDVLPALEREGERFGAIVFADVLEHLEDPVSALDAARRLASPGARLLVSVPNVGHLSIVRDLIAGRFDPIPAGLTDAGHLRWFTRSFLAEAIAEAGWTLASLESEPGAPASAPGELLALADAWPEADRESLLTYQWIAIAAA